PPTGTPGVARGGAPAAAQGAAPGQEAAAAGGMVAAQNLPEAMAYSHATFWERMGAAFLDMVLVGLLSAIVHVPALGFIVALAYFAGMWTWKGTTVGGIVLGLKVVRQDGQPMTLLVALVRALAAAFSIAVCFLGILWIGW